VLVFAANVEFRLQIGCHSTSGTFKFRVTKNIGDPKAAFVIDPMDSLEGFDEGCLLSVKSKEQPNRSEGKIKEQVW
jgi:hypothetical protein